MKRLLIGGCVTVALHAFSADVDSVLVRQMWPWSTDVRVEYRLTHVTSPVNLKVRAWEGEAELDAEVLRSAISGDVYGIDADGTGHFTIDPVKAFGTDRSALGNFKVSVSAEAAAANVNEVLYKIVDMTSGAIEDVRRSDFLNGYRGSYETNFAKVGPNFTTTLNDVLVWTDVTNHTEYMTSKMVFRKIPAKGVTWQMGESEEGPESYQNKPPCWVQLTNDYFIGVFPVTQYQYYSLRKLRGSVCTNKAQYADCDYYPAAGIPYGDLRGYTYGASDSWPATGHEVPSWTASAVMRRLCNLQVDLPTEAQWEFACRAGVYDKALFSGKTFGKSAILELAWVSENSDGALHPVNTKYPNAFGLYSMLGNSYEWTLGSSGAFSTGYTQESPELEPSGGSGSYRMSRSCPYTYSRSGATAALRAGIKYDSTGFCTGFRLCFSAE